MEKIGLIFKKARKALSPKITQGELAKKVDIGQSYIAQIEAGTKIPSYEVAANICKELNLDFKLIERSLLANDAKDKIGIPSGSTVTIDPKGRIIITPKGAVNQRKH